MKNGIRKVAVAMALTMLFASPADVFAQADMPVEDIIEEQGVSEEVCPDDSLGEVLPEVQEDSIYEPCLGIGEDSVSDDDVSGDEIKKNVLPEEDDSPEPILYPCSSNAIPLNSIKVKVKILKPGKIRYNGMEQKPVLKSVKARIDKQWVELIEGVDYKVTYENNIAAWTGGKYNPYKPTIVIHGINLFTGEYEQPFKIKRLSIKVVSANNIGDLMRVGAITCDQLRELKGSYKKCAVQITPKVYAYNPYTGAQLHAGYDFEYKYGANNKVGKGSVTLKGIGNYSGSKKLTFRIMDHVSFLEKLAMKYPKKVIWNKPKSYYEFTAWLREHGVKDDITPLDEDKDENPYTEEEMKEHYSLDGVTIKGTNLGNVYVHMPENFEEYCSYNSDYFVDKDLYSYPLVVLDAGGTRMQAGIDYELMCHTTYADGEHRYWARIIGLGQYEGSIKESEFVCNIKTENQTAQGRYFRIFFRDYLNNVYHGLWSKTVIPSQFERDHVVDKDWFDYYPDYRNPKATYEYYPVEWDCPL